MSLNSSYLPQNSVLEDTIVEIDEFIRQFEETDLPTVVRDTKLTLQTVNQTTFQTASNLESALKSYASLVKQDKEAAIRAETESKTKFHVDHLMDDLDTAKKHVQQYKSFREQEQREVNVVQHQINALSTQTDGNNNNNNNNNNGDDDNNNDNENELSQLEEDLSTLQAQVHIYEQLSGLVFLEKDPNNPSKIEGFAKLNNFGDFRPFEIDLNETSPEMIQDLIWGWLYDEHCVQSPTR